MVIFIAVGFGIEILNNGTVIVTFYDYVTIVLGSSWIWTFRIFFIVFLQAGAHLTLFSTRVGGAGYAHHITACPPGFENLIASLFKVSH